MFPSPSKPLPPPAPPGWPWWLYGGLAALLLLLIATSLHTYQAGLRMNRNDLPRFEAAMGIKLKLANAHLRFEELLGGSRPAADIAQVRLTLEQSERLVAELLALGPQAETGLDTTEDLERLGRNLRLFRAITDQRFTNSVPSRAGFLTRQYDDTYHQLITSATRVQAGFRQAHLSRLQEFRKASGALLLGSLIMALLVSTVFWRLERRRASMIAKLQQAHQQLALSENRLNTTMRSMGDGLITTDTSGRVTYLNPVAEALTGWPLEKARGRAVEEVFRIVNHQTREPAPNPVVAVLKKKMVVGLANHTLLLARGGQEYAIADSGAPIVDANGQITGVVLVFHDVSEQYQARQRLAENEQRYRTLFDGTRSGVAVYQAVDAGEDFVFLDFNRAAERIERINRQEVIGRRLRQVFPGVEESGILAVFQRVWRTGRPEQMPVTRYEDGRIAGWRENFVYRLPSGELVAVYDDLTEKMRLEAELRQAQKMEAIGTLAGGIAHDFNNMLNAILGYAELSQLDLEPGHPVRVNLEEIVKASNRAAELVKQILTFSRQNEQERRPLSLQPVLKEGVRMLRGVLPTTITIKTVMGRCPGQVLANVTELHQILMNLCTNAYHAMRESGGTLTIGLDQKEFTAGQNLPPELAAGSYQRLTVRDTGCGMSKAVLERIFEPYFTTKRLGEGTGLGLATVHGIVRSHGGAIRVTSRPGQGACFEVFFPVIKEETPGQEPAPEEETPLPRFPGTRVLFVDDESTLAELGGKLLRRLGCLAEVFTDSRQALARFEQEPEAFDLVISDQTMPGLTGLELAERLLAIRPGLPVVLCTGYSELVNRERALGVGIWEFMMKPLAVHSLAELLELLPPTPHP